MRRSFPLLVLLCSLAVIAATGRAAEVKPNIVYILADDAGVGDFACYGGKYVATPNIDKLAAEGMLFTRAYSGSAVCAPTRCVLNTGLHTGHCRRRANQSKDGLIFLEPSDATVAEALHKAGYATGGFGKWGLGNPGSDGVPEKKGFDVFFGYYDQVHAHNYYTDHLIRNSVDVPLPGNANGKKGQYSADVIGEESLKFIEANKDHPFFLYCPWTPPHGDYVIPSNAPYGTHGWPEKIANYAAMVAWVDTNVGKVMSKLKELGLDDHTIVFFTSDNGANPEFITPLGSTGGLRGYKRLLYEGGTRAPQIVRWPGHIKPGAVSDLLTTHVDFFNTATELAGAATTAGDGISIVPTLTGGSQTLTHKHLYFEIYEPYFQQALRLGDWKGYRRGTQAPLELYDLKTDPGESRDIASAHADVVRQIEAIMVREHVPSPHWKALEQPTKQPKSKTAPAGESKAKKTKAKAKGKTKETAK